MEGPYTPGKDGVVKHYTPTVGYLNKVFGMNEEALVLEIKKEERNAFETRGRWLTLHRELERKLADASPALVERIRKMLR